MKFRRSFFVFILIGLLPTISGAAAKERLILGGNFNEHSEMIPHELLKKSETRLIRGFIPASPFIRGERELGSDAAVQNLKKAARDGQQIILCLKWDFKRGKWRVPGPGTDLERKCFQWVDDLLMEVGDGVIVLETINEVMVDTHEEDVVPDDSGNIPMVVFQKRLVDHLHDRGKPPPIYMGAFTRLDREHMQTHPITLAMFDWINSDDRITGTNFHIHMPEFEGFKTYLEFIRGHIPVKPFIITEFSMVWKYRAALKHPIGRFVKGKAFAEKYDRDPETTVRDFINLTIDQPVTQTEWNDFLRSQYWYDKDFLDKACEIMDAYGVRYATYAFQQGSSGPGKLGPDSNPWILNPLYSQVTAAGENGKVAVNEDFMSSYGKWR
jgi:hypothetical protein